MHRSLLLAAIVVLGGCHQTIQHGLDELQANEIETVLQDAGLEASKEKEGGRDAKWAISVPTDQTAAAMKILAEHELPRQRPPGFNEVFGQGSMVPTATEENARYVHALSGEISRTLTSVEGVVHARVHLVTTPAAPASFRPPPESRASVLLKVRHGQGAALSGQREDIRALVAGSVDSLKPENVSVMISELPAPANVPSRPGPPGFVRPVLIGAAVLIALLSVALAFTILSTRRMRMRATATEPAPAEAPPASAPAAVRRVA